MATSGYLYTKSIDPSYADADGLWTSTFMPKADWFGAPVHAGTVTHLDMLLFKQGTPNTNLIAQLYFAPADVTSSSFSFPTSLGTVPWSLMAVATIDVSSVTATVRSTATWVRAAFNTPCWLDSVGAQQPGDPDPNAFAFTYALVFTRITSWGTSSMDIKFPFRATENIHWGSQGSRGERREESSNFADIPFALYGLQSVSSLWRDKPMGGTWTTGSKDVNSYYLSLGTNFRRVSRFTAVGSKITRFAFDVDFDGSNRIQLVGLLYTDSGGVPNTLVATSNLVKTQFDGDASNIFGGDLDDLALPVLFTFSGGVNIVSGDFYWAGIEVRSYNTSGTHAKMLVDRHAGKRRAASTVNSPGVWFIASNQNHPFEIWYVDSETVHTYSIDIASPQYSPSAALNERRLFPSAANRLQPTFALREFPRP